MDLRPTLNDLLPEVRRATIENLSPLLAGMIDLQLRSKHAHWNVRGPGFLPVHEMLDKLAADVSEYADLIAERIVQLGGQAHGLLSELTGASQIGPYKVIDNHVAIHLSAMADSISQIGTRVRQTIDQVTEIGDADSADLLTEVSRGLDKWLWFVEAHLD